MTQPSWSCSASTSTVSATAARPACSNTSLQSHAKVIVYKHIFFLLDSHEIIAPIVLDPALGKEEKLKVPLIFLKQ